MALTREFVEAVSQENILRVKIMLKDSLLLDKSFNQFNEMLKYAESKLDCIWVSDDEDADAFSKSSEDLNTILVGLVNNFSRRRVNYLKDMINTLYPLQPKTIHTSRREEVVIVKKTRKFMRESRKIIDDKKKIEEILGRNQIYTKDIEEVKRAAMSIVSHCDNIIRK